MGIWVYADDIILLSPTRTGLQEMVKIYENFAKATKLKFSTNIRIEKCKTKERINYNEITPILLNELPLPFVNFSFQKFILLTKNFILTVLMSF